MEVMMRKIQTYRWATGALTLALLAGLTGCPPFHSKPALSGSGMEMFAPVLMRVHPLSRVVSDGKTARLQARIELTDQMGDVGKGVGTGTLELYEYQRLLPGHRGHRIGQWTIDIGTPETNRAHWDAITRTYLFDIPLDAKVVTPNSRYMVVGTFILPSGTKLQDDQDVMCK